MLDSHYEELFRLIMRDIDDPVARETHQYREAIGDFDRPNDEEEPELEDDNE